MIVNNGAVTSKDRTQHSVERAESLPRLLSLRQIEREYGVSYWLCRGWIIDGVLRPVRLPGSRLKAKGGRVIANSRSYRIRKILVDRRDIERLIQESKEL